MRRFVVNYPYLCPINLYHKNKYMKKLLLSLAAFSLVLSACDNTPKYTINGTIQGDQTGNILLVSENGNQLDTLGKAAIKNGKFKLTGHVDSLTIAYASIEGSRYYVPVFLENADYTASIDIANPMENKVEGTKNQAVINSFIALNKELQKGRVEIQQEYMAANQAKDTEKMTALESKMEELIESTEAKEEDLLKQNPDTYATAFLLLTKMGQMEYEQLNPLYDLLSPEIKASKPGKEVGAYLSRLATTAVGKVAPDFTLETPDGTPLSMHSVKGKIKVLDFWASWCGPCRAENPNVVELYKKFHPKGLEIIGVSLDENKDQWQQAIKDDKLAWKQMSDLKGWQSEVAQLYGVSAIPHTVILDENNVIIAKNLRGKELEEKIAVLLQ